ncbi:hypothetical protein HpDR98_14210 [Helicobacter pylori]
MEFYKRVLKLHQFRNLGRKSPTELLLNSSFEKHGGLVILVGENNVGKSNVLEALTIFNDADVKLCSEEYYFKNHKKDTLLSLEEEAILDHKITDFSCVDLKIQTEEIGEGLKELSKTLISYPFCVFIGGFINLIMSYGVLDSFLKSYKEKLKLSAFSTRQANNLLFKKLIKHLSGNNQLVKNFCQYIREIIEYNAPNKEYKPNQFFIIGKGKQNQLEKIYSRLKRLNERKIEPKDVKSVLKDMPQKVKTLDEIFRTTDFDEKFAPKIKVLQNEQSQERLSNFIKDIIKEIDEKYPISENFKRQFRTFRLNIGNLKKKIKNSLKSLEKTREDFERKKESWIKEIGNDCKNQKVLEFNYDVLLDNIEQICKKYIASHAVNENYLETHATKGTQLGFIGLSTPKTHSQKVSLEVLDNAHELENKNPLDEAQELLESLSSYDENGNLIAPSKKELENELKEKEAKSVNLDEELAKGCKFDVYSDVLRHLVQMGIPQNEIAFIHDAKTEEQKQDLFKRVNRGEVRVLLGSPAKMGVGTNVQERLVAMHELDCQWRPDELLQMEGRGIRQGNILHQNDPENFRMKIYRYATEKTYDSRMWQIIETKSKGIEQFRNAHKLGLNELEDFNMGSSNASEMKAEATGNPLIIEEVKLRAKIKSEESKYKAFNKEHYFNEESLKNNASQLDYLKQELKDLETLQSSVIIPTHTEIKLYDLKNEESKDYELIKVKEVEPLKENASMSEELTHKKLKEQNKQIAEQNKEKLDAIKKQFASNLNTLFLNEEEDYKLLEYKGFMVNAYKTKYQVEFSLSPKDNPNIAYSPSNMVYKNDTQNMFSSYNFCGEIKFDGFLKRLDNAITKLPEKIKELENSIETTQENIAKYTRLVEQKPSYPRLEYLQALKWDHKTLIDDLARMSKDRDYKPVFNPKSKEVLKNLNAEKRASLENESVTEEIKEQANQEAHRPMKKAVNDDYDMGM